jgi:uncharacterized protein (DUF433 family)
VPASRETNAPVLKTRPIETSVGRRSRHTDPGEPVPGGASSPARSSNEVETMDFRRITVDPRQMGGVPCLRGLRIPVATVVGMVADGVSDEEILQAYPDLEREDIREALRYAAAAVQERELPLLPGR